MRSRSSARRRSPLRAGRKPTKRNSSLVGPKRKEKRAARWAGDGHDGNFVSETKGDEAVAGVGDEGHSGVADERDFCALLQSEDEFGARVISLCSW